MIRKYHNHKLQTKSYRTFTVTRLPKDKKSLYDIVVIDYFDFNIFRIGLNFGIVLTFNTLLFPSSDIQRVGEGYSSACLTNYKKVFRMVDCKVSFNRLQSQESSIQWSGFYVSLKFLQLDKLASLFVDDFMWCF